MTSTNGTSRTLFHFAARSIFACAAFVLGGCATHDAPLTAPATLVAPYNTVHGEVLWAVVPLRNESGTSEAEKVPVSDKLAAAVEEIQGVRCVPLDRTIDAMRALKMTSVQSAGDVRRLAAAMGVDGILAGSITSYDPYTPSLGLSLALFSRGGGSMSPGESASTDPRALRASATERPTTPTGAFRDAPVATASANLDAKNNQVLMDLRQYAQGRMDGASAVGWRRYAASMDLYAEFAVHHLLGQLVQDEWVRLAATPVEQPGEFPGRN